MKEGGGMEWKEGGRKGSETRDEEGEEARFHLGGAGGYLSP